MRRVVRPMVCMKVILTPGTSGVFSEPTVKIGAPLVTMPRV